MISLRQAEGRTVEAAAAGGQSGRMACDETLAACVRKVLSPAAGFAEQKLFGGLCFLAPRRF
jgi:hypothetical protein